VDLSVRRQLLVKEFYVAPPGRNIRNRSPCPIPGSEYLPPDRVFPLTIYILRTTDDHIVYGCNDGIILSTINFRYVASSQSENPTSSPVIPTDVSGSKRFKENDENSHLPLCSQSITTAVSITIPDIRTTYEFTNRGSRNVSNGFSHSSAHLEIADTVSRANPYPTSRKTAHDTSRHADNFAQ